MLYVTMGVKLLTQPITVGKRREQNLFRTDHHETLYVCTNRMWHHVRGTQLIICGTEHFCLCLLGDQHVRYSLHVRGTQLIICGTEHFCLCLLGDQHVRYSLRLSAD
jgi:hypothetical protein